MDKRIKQKQRDYISINWLLKTDRQIGRIFGVKRQAVACMRKRIGLYRASMTTYHFVGKGKTKFIKAEGRYI